MILGKKYTRFLLVLPTEPVFSLPMNESKSIKNWSEDERPREKMLQKGPGALTDAELMAILINSGTRTRSALDLGRDILAMANNNLGELGRLTVMDMQKTKGIGEARAITISAALELGRRRQMADVLMRQTISSSRDAAEIVVAALQDFSNEVFYVLYLNQSNKLIRQETLSSGGMTATVVDIRMILKNALLHNANKLIVAHNHPSGSLIPSREDKDVTQRLKSGGELMDIKLMDHIIVGGNKYLSFADEGLL